MSFNLYTAADATIFSTIERCDARFWTVNFPRPMMASVITTAARDMRVDCAFYRKDDLCGLIWDSEDHWDHPLLAYLADRDFRGCVMSFRWESAGIIALDELHGPTLTIEGRDELGAAKTWYVRLWNYAVGDPEAADITLDFDDLDGGFTLPGEADPVWAGDIDRMFMSLVPPGYTTADEPLDMPAEGWATMTGLAVTGSVLTIANHQIVGHRRRMAMGYDDAYNLTPARVLRNIGQLGYRGLINHYVGMSHYFRLDADLLVVIDGGALNTPCAAWHGDFATRAKAAGHGLIFSLSYELFNEHCPDAWAQRDSEGNRALTGWEPPSTLLSPCLPEATSYLDAVAEAFCAILESAGLAIRFQVGEPWWWCPTWTTSVPCFYDAATTALFTAETSLTPPVIVAMTDPMDVDDLVYLDWLGGKLGASTIALADHIRAAFPGATIYLLFYAPQVLGAETPELHRANLPVASWAAPAFDVLQLEDYDFVIDGETARSAEAAATITDTLGYPASQQHYFSGFVLLEADAGTLWPLIADAADVGAARGVPQIFYWALPQIMRDGFTYEYAEGEPTGGLNMKKYQDTVLTRAAGTPLEGASVTVYLTGTTTKAVLYEENDVGGDELANPLVTDSFGSFYFYVADGTYDLRIDFGSETPRTLTDVEIYDLDEMNENIETGEGLDAELAALAETISAANTLPYYTGSGTAGTTAFPAFARTLIGSNTAAAAQITLALQPGADVQEYSAQLDLLAALTTTSFGRSLVEIADLAALKTLLGVGAVRVAGFATTTPTASEVLLDYIASEDFDLADDFAGSEASIGTNPTASFALSVNKNGAAVGSLTFSTLGVPTFATTGGAVSMTPGDLLSVVAPASADATAANMRFNFLGELT